MGIRHRAHNISREGFNGVVGREAPHNTVLKRHRILWVTMLVGTGVLFSALQSCGFRPRSIDSLSKIRQYPTKVTVEGVVGDRVPLVDQYVYELEDTSGTIWVQTSRQLPDAHSNLRVKVKGQLQRYPISELGSGYGELFIQELSHQVIDQ